jgi:hypothetical protein
VLQAIFTGVTAHAPATVANIEARPNTNPANMTRSLMLGTVASSLIPLAILMPLGSDLLSREKACQGNSRRSSPRMTRLIGNAAARPNAARRVVFAISACAARSP